MIDMSRLDEKGMPALNKHLDHHQPKATTGMPGRMAAIYGRIAQTGISPVRETLQTWATGGQGRHKWALGTIYHSISEPTGYPNSVLGALSGPVAKS